MFLHNLGFLSKFYWNLGPGLTAQALEVNLWLIRSEIPSGEISLLYKYEFTFEGRDETQDLGTSLAVMLETLVLSSPGEIQVYLEG